LYDLVPTVLFDRLPRRCAMTINAVFDDLAEVMRDDLVAEVVGRRRWGLPPGVVEDLLDGVCDEAVAAVQDVDVPTPLADHVTRRAADLAPGLRG
jgi:hypothetical protein